MSIRCQGSYSLISSSSTYDIFFDLYVRFRFIEVERKSNEFILVPNYMGSAFSSLPYCRKVIIQVLEQMTARKPRFIDALKLFSSIWLKS